MPDMASARYRCAACGNLTRFDVVTDRRTRAFHHYSVGGELTVEDQEVLSETVVEVTCRWCGHGRQVETLSDTAEVSPAEMAAEVAADAALEEAAQHPSEA